MKCETCGEIILPARIGEGGTLIMLDPALPTYEVISPGPPGDPSGLNPVIVGEKCPGLLKPGGIHGDGCRASRLAVHRCRRG